MSDERKADGIADAKATVAIMSILVVGLYFWLSGMPT